MAAAIEEPGFCLPSEFFTDDDFTNLPSEFPYHFETHADNLLQLQKFSTMSTSPHTALAYLSAPSAKYDAVEDLIYQAAAHVAKLRGYAANSSPPPPSYLPQFHKQAKIPAASVYPKFGNFGTRAAGGGVGQVAWAPHQVCGGSAAAKKACAGTGVFLPSPRRYSNISVSNAISSGPRRNQGCSASSSTSIRASPQSYTKPSYTSIYRFVESQPEPLPQPMDLSNYNSVLPPPRHAMVLQQRRSFVGGGPLMIGRDQQCLPWEWTY